MSARAVRSEKLDLRLSYSDKRTLEAAASVSSRSVSAFVPESALARADRNAAPRPADRCAGYRKAGFS